MKVRAHLARPKSHCHHTTIDDHIHNPREHEETERDTEGVGCDVSVTKVIFSFRKSVFRDVRTD